MVNEPSVGVGFAVDVVDCVESILETLVNPNPIALSLVCLVMKCDRFVHLCLLVDICKLVFSQ